VNEAKVTSKGQITIPKEVRDDLGLRPGDAIKFVKENGNYVVRKARTDDPFPRWSGYLKHLAGKDPDQLVEEMRGR
jgi:AbrB family looped-hinge helix DNA binding protein